MTVTRDRLYINGSWVKPEGETRLSVWESATGDEMGSVVMGTSEDVDAAVGAQLPHSPRGGRGPWRIGPSICTPSPQIYLAESTKPSKSSCGRWGRSGPLPSASSRLQQANLQVTLRWHAPSSGISI